MPCNENEEIQGVYARNGSVYALIEGENELIGGHPH